MRILSNPEVKKYNLNLFLIFIASIIIMLFVNIMSLNIIKDNIVINNQSIVGNILSKHPELENDIVDIIVNTLIIALSTNLMNLFDLRPGRAIKAYLVIMIPIYITLTGYTKVFPLLILPNVLAYFNIDLKARGMMGDTGSNVLGISIGVLMALGYGIKVRLAWLVFLILMHLITEKFSLTKIIEKNRVLKFIDNLGR